MKLNVTKITKMILDVMFGLGVLIVATIPFILQYLSKYFGVDTSKYLWLLIAVYALSGIFALLIVWELRKMFKTVINSNCFVKENVYSLSKMGNYSFAIAIVMVLKSFFYVTIASLAMIVVFIIAGLFSKVLAQVFERAISYKLENDLTI